MTADDYFSGGASRAPGVVGTYGRLADQPEIEAAPGVRLRPVRGRGLMLSWVTIDPHSEAPAHVHDEEQMGVVISGSCEFHLDGITRPMVAGDTYHAPAGVPHGVRTGPDPCTVLDAFAPPRAALVALMGTTAGPDGE